MFYNLEYLIIGLIISILIFSIFRNFSTILLLVFSVIYILGYFYWNPNIYIQIFFLILLFLIFHLAYKKNILYTEIANFKYAYFSILSVLFFQISQNYMRSSGISNEDRSMFLYGIEIHHIVWGCFFLIISRFLSEWNKLGDILFFMGCGFIFDEVYYSFYEFENEAIYFSSANISVAIILCAFQYVALWLKYAKK